MSERIRPIWAEDQYTGATECWQPPEMASQPPEEPTEEPAPEIPSVEAIERWQAEARAEAAEEGRREGFAAGFADGRQTGLEQGRAEMDRLAGQLQGLLDSLQNPAAEIDAAVEQSLGELALAIAQQIIRREIRIQPGEIVGVVRAALAELPLGDQQVCLRVNPEDAAVLTEAGVAGEWRVSEDPSISRGGCLLDSGPSHIDARLESRIAQVAVSLLGDTRRAGDTPEPEAGDHG